jgi:hypothetical protein
VTRDASKVIDERGTIVTHAKATVARRRLTLLAAAAIVALLASQGASCGEGTGEALRRADELAIGYKLTPTIMHTNNQPTAYDVNVRANVGPHAAWVGYYQRASEFRQTRVGYEHSLELPFGRLVPSFQYATRGFLGGSVNAEVGELHFLLAGFGRTNKKDYYNLNFDPNDAITLGAGTRALPKTSLSLFQVRDDRLGTGQRVIHLVARIKPDERTRWTIDGFYKQGRSPDDDEIVRGKGIAITYDYDRYFVRVANDPYVNFTHTHMVRVAAGVRF